LQFIVAVNHPHFFFCGKQCSFLLWTHFSFNKMLEFLTCKNLPVTFDDWSQNKNLNSKIPRSAPSNFSWYQPNVILTIHIYTDFILDLDISIAKDIDSNPWMTRLQIILIARMLDTFPWIHLKCITLNKTPSTRYCDLIIVAVILR
jgi:hypothetical protein